MNEQNISDVMQLFVVFASSLFDASIAEVIGPYLLIVFAAVTGACWSLGKRESKGGWHAFFYFIRIVFTAILLTSVIAHLVTRYFNVSDVDLLIAPVALVIGVVGDDWLKAFSWLLDVIKKAVNKIVNKKLGE